MHLISILVKLIPIQFFYDYSESCFLITNQGDFIERKESEELKEMEASCYKITLTKGEYDTSQWCIDRGYLPDDIIRDSHEYWNGDESEVTLYIPEHAAWSLLDYDDDDESKYTCMSLELYEKWVALEFQIV